MAATEDDGFVLGWMGSEAIDPEGHVTLGERVLIDHLASRQVDHLDVLSRRVADVQSRLRLVELDPIRDDPVHRDTIDDLLGRLVPDEHLVGIGRDVPGGGLGGRRCGQGADEECREGDRFRRSHEFGRA